jgi:hypothetical protein
MNRALIPIEKILSFLFFLFIIISLDPYFIWFYNTSFYLRVFLYVFILINSAYYLHFHLKWKVGRGDVLIFISYIVLIIYAWFPRELGGHLSFAMLFTGIFLIMPIKVKMLVWEYFIRFHIVFISIGFLSYLSILFGLQDPVSYLSLDSGRGYFIFLFTTFIDHADITFSTEVGIFSRFMGYLNEPGFLGVINALIIIASRFELSKANLILFITGIFTISLGFYFLIIIGSFLTFYNQKKEFFVRNFIILFAFIGALFFFKDSEIINNLLISRLDISDTGISGYRRGDGGNIVNLWLSSDLLGFLFGVGGTEGPSSFYLNLIQLGVIGVVFIVLILLLIPVQMKIKRYPWVFLFLLFLTSFLKPGVFYINYLIIIYYATYTLNQDNFTKKYEYK